MRRWFWMFLAVWAVISISVTTVRAGEDLSNVIGIVHDAGVYYFGSLDYMDQGVNAVVATGTHVIKIEMNQYDLLNTWTSSNGAKYPWNSAWPALSGSTTLTTIANTQYFKNLFSNPNINTYVITAYCPELPSGGDGTEYWINNGDPLPSPDTTLEAETTQLQNVCANLMATYKGMNKTFLFENWEGDWALRDGPGKNLMGINGGHNGPITQTIVNNNIEWFNARAAGVHAAMAANPTSTVKCYATMEVNRVGDAINEGASYTSFTLTDDSLPNTSVDYASYSSYDTEINTSGTYSLPNAIQWMADHLPPTAVNGQSPASVYIGEYGLPETPGTGNYSSAQISATLNNVVNTVIAEGMPYACYWVIMDNDIASGLTAPVNGNDSAVQGYWFIKPDGTPGTAWNQYRVHIIGFSPTRANTTEITSGLDNYYTSAFPSSGSNLGSGWSTNTDGGDYTIAAESGNAVMQLVQNASSNPVGLATLNIDTAASRGLQPGEYLQFSLKRLSNAGYIGLTLFNTNHGSNSASGNQPIEVYSVNGWTPFSFSVSGSNPSYNWANNNTLGVRLDSADGTFATCSFYLNGAYIGSWLYQTTSQSLTSMSLFAQSNALNSSFQFGNVSLFLNPDDLPDAAPAALISSSTMDANSTVETTQHPATKRYWRDSHR